LRAWLERKDRSGNSAELNGWLAALDPIAFGRIDLRNRRRVLRAIEVALLTGRPFSEAGARRGRGVPVLKIGLRLSRDILHRRIERRIAAMLDAGWLDEVRRLLLMGFAPGLPAMSATGYPEMVAVVEGRLSLDEAVVRTRRATHSFVRRQETWLRAGDGIEWVDATGTPREIAEKLVADHPELEA
jgi:tRNA dimethylallyltransferase